MAHEHVEQALQAEALEQLWQDLADAISTDDVAYWPPEKIASDIEDLQFLAVHKRGAIVLDKVEDSEEGEDTCSLKGGIEADVQWASFHPTGFDLERFAGLQENKSSDSPILQGNESAVPFDVNFTAIWDGPGDCWRDVEVGEVTLAEPLLAERKGRMSLEEEEEIDKQYSDVE